MIKGMIELKDHFSDSPNSVFKVEFKDGDTFFLSHLKDCSQAAEKLNTWTGIIVKSEGLSEKRRKLHRIGGLLEFSLSDIESISKYESL
jgi:hypothetical protein